ncbi:MAG: O-antigen ligase family protein [Clostridia bacterium]
MWGSNRKIYFSISIITVLYLFSILYLSNSSILSYIGFFSSVLLVVICFFLALRAILQSKINSTWYGLLIIIIYNAVLMFVKLDTKSVYIFSQQIALLVYMSCLSIISIDERKLAQLYNFMYRFYIVFTVVLVFIILLKKQEEFLLVFSGTLFKVYLTLVYFSFLNNRNITSKVLLAVTILLNIGERTSMIIIIAIFFLEKILFYLRSSKKLYYLIFWIIIFVSVIFPYVYLWLFEHPLGITINQLIKEITGENFFSGRQVIWKYAFDLVKGKEFFGLGISNNMLGESLGLSTHNLYIYLLLQGGYFLLALFIFYLFSLWKQLFLYIENQKIRWTMAYFLGLLIFVDFELVLLVNNFVVSLYLWLPIGYGFLMINKKIQPFYTRRMLNR